MQPDSTTEITYWLIPGFDETYRLCVPNEGQPWVESCLRKICLGNRGGTRQEKTSTWKRLKELTGSNGYYYFNLFVNKKRIVKRLHRLVAEWKCPAILPTDLARHLNDEKLDNRPVNIALGTFKDNSDDAEKNGRRVKGERNGHSKVTEEIVRTIRSRYAAGGITHRELGEEYGLERSSVQAIEKKINWRHVI